MQQVWHAVLKRLKREIFQSSPLPSERAHTGTVPGNFVNNPFNPSFPCRIEINTRDMRQNIDTPWLLTETEETTPIREVLWANASQRHAKLGERRIGRVCVSRVGLYEEVDVFGEAGLGMEDDRETADDQVLNAMGMEGGQKVFVILVHPAASLNP